MTVHRTWDGDRRVSAVGDVPANFAFRSEADAWRISGDVDCAVEIALGTALDAACASGTGDVHLLVDSVRFVDAAGARVFVTAASRLEPPRRLVLHGLAEAPRKVFRLTGWDRAANIVIEEAR